MGRRLSCSSERCETGHRGVLGHASLPLSIKWRKVDVAEQWLGAGEASCRILSSISSMRSCCLEAILQLGFAAIAAIFSRARPGRRAFIAYLISRSLLHRSGRDRVFVCEFSLAGPSLNVGETRSFASWLVEQMDFASAGCMLWSYDNQITAWSRSEHLLVALKMFCEAYNASIGIGA